jgi:hypothetical protein
MIRGAENLARYNAVFSKVRLVMTLPLLKILGHEIAKSNWSTCNKKVFWCVCTTAFFGSFRLGELLAPGKNKQSPETLTWDKVKFLDNNSALIEIKFPKSNKKHGDFVDIFCFKNHNCCPVTTLKALYESKQSDVKKNLPVFTLDDGSFLTQSLFNSKIEKFLRPYIKDASKISGHSFRAAIPSALANSQDVISEFDIQLWGRWSSDSYKAYTRLKYSAKQNIFSKVVEVQTRHAGGAGRVRTGSRIC